MGRTIKTKYENRMNEQNIQEIIREELGQKFIQALEDAGVFKRDEEGYQRSNVLFKL